MINFKTVLKKAAENHAYIMGGDAYDSGDSCPFDKDSPAYKEWMNGWEDAEFLGGTYEGRN